MLLVAFSPNPNPNPYRRCNVIALPSTGKEGLPNVLLETNPNPNPNPSTDRYTHCGHSPPLAMASPY